jgi:hypothetical protein
MAELLKLKPEFDKAYKDCTSLENPIMKARYGDIQQCITDVEGLIPDIEKIIADLKAGNETAAIIALTLLKPKLEAAYKDCTGSGMKVKKVGDIQQCITDVEGLIPDIEKIIADLKAGNETAAIIALTLLKPKLEAAYKDCTGSGKRTMSKFLRAIENADPNDLPTCISDLEAMIPDVEKVIADFKAGNYE